MPFKITATLLGFLFLSTLGLNIATSQSTNTGSVYPVPSGTYKLDQQHGYVTVSYSHFGWSEPVLSFDNVTATITFDNEAPTNSRVDVKIKASSIDSGVDEFDGHLKSDQWFNTRRHKNITLSLIHI